MEIGTSGRRTDNRGTPAARAAAVKTAATRTAALTVLVATPVLAWMLAVATCESGAAIAHDLSQAPSLALAPVALGEALAVVAGAGGAAVAAHLSVMSLVLVATPQRSRVRRAAHRFTPPTWRRVVAVAATGVASAGLALPAVAAPGDSDAGWVPEPIAHEASVAESPPSHPVLPPPAGSGSDTAEAPSQAAPPDRSADALYVVTAGDSLWSITADAREGGLRDGAVSLDAEAIAEGWPELYDANRGVVGPDPSLIHPGQELAIPEGWGR